MYNSSVNICVNMKVQFVILLVAIVVQDLDAFSWNDAKSKAAKAECAKETDFDPATLSKGDPHDEANHKGDIKEQCFFRCFSKKTGLINDKDEIILEKAKKIMKHTDVEEIEKIIKQCTADTKEEDPCAKVDKITHCFFTHLKKKS